MDNQVLISLITGACGLAGGGAMVAVVNAIANKKKNSTDIASANIATANNLRELAVNQYLDAETRLNNARNELDDVQDLLRDYKRYTEYVCDMLEKNKIDYLPFDKWREREL